MRKSWDQWKSLVWPPIDSGSQAKLFRLPALIMAVLSAIIWAIVAVVGLNTQSDHGVYPVVISNLYIFISYGLYKMRLEAAIACLVISIIGLIYNYGNILMFKDMAMLIIDIYAIKATVAYKAFKGNIGG